VIVDSAGNIGLYGNLDIRLTRALTLLVETDFRVAELGKREVEGSSLFFIVQAYETKAREKGVWESHRKYLDVQYVVEGTEKIGWAATALLSVMQPYNLEKDVTLYEGDGDFIVMRPGMFIVLWPHDGHMPGIAVTDPVHVRKVVVKVLLNG
jgi:YhcH/YjgK/YiaL family protein